MSKEQLVNAYDELQRVHSALVDNHGQLAEQHATLQAMHEETRKTLAALRSKN